MKESISENSQRVLCTQCQRPLARCLCGFVVPTANRVELLILQHPLEVNNAKNSLGLLNLSLKNSHIKIGEQFNKQELHAWLYTGAKTPLLLYPDTPEEKSLGMDSAAALPNLDMYSPDQLRLVVIDGTWRKSRKLLYENRLLQRLPRYSLRDTPTSMYTIRKAHSKNQLSTLEASCYALQQLEQTQIDYAPLLKAFTHFVAQQQAFLPPESRH